MSRVIDWDDGEWRSGGVPPEQHLWRLDKALVAWLPEFSRSWLQQLIDQGLVYINDRICTKPATKIKAGSQWKIHLIPSAAASSFVPETMNLNIIHEDEHLLVLNKPVGLVVHPAAGHWQGTLLNGLLAYHAGAAEVPRAGIVHRLDKDTSGLMVVAKTRSCMDGLTTAIAERRVTRQYMAIAHHHGVIGQTKTVTQAIGRDKHHRLKMTVLPEHDPTAKSAKTDFEWRNHHHGVSVLWCRLHTGRTHQIRVHAAWLGCPLVGDVLYGGKKLFQLERQALHATYLSFEHPIHQQTLSFCVAPPQDMQQACLLAGMGDIRQWIPADRQQAIHPFS